MLKKIVLCPCCNRPEYWKAMRWRGGQQRCRDCYKEDYEREFGKPYAWDDLDGPRPTMEEYNKQEEGEKP